MLREGGVRCRARVHPRAVKSDDVLTGVCEQLKSETLKVAINPRNLPAFGVLDDEFPAHIKVMSAPRTRKAAGQKTRCVR